uniref:Potassium channel domain-containing protein n=1 Tax=Plectus sambesii TaxID=2011161 RepID=A0A914X9X1_9BILA
MVSAEGSGGGRQAWMMAKSALKALIALVIFLAYALLAAVIIREAEWRNEHLNSEAAKDRTILVDQLRYELVAKLNELIKNPHNNSTLTHIKQLLDAYHNASYVSDVKTNAAAKHLIVDDNGMQMWSLPRSLTFVLTAFTLIGYGDIVPLTDAGRLTIVCLTVFGAVFMLFFMSSASTAQSRAIDAFCDVIVKRCGRGGPSLRLHADDHESLTTYAATHNESETNLILDHFRFLVRRAVARFVLGLIFLASSISLGAFVKKLEEKEWSWLTSYYFTFQTFSTIGFGDVVPRRFATKECTMWYAIFFFAYILCSLSVMSVVIGFGISLFRTVMTTANAFLPDEKEPDGDEEGESKDTNPAKDRLLGDCVKIRQYIP